MKCLSVVIVSLLLSSRVFAASLPAGTNIVIEPRSLIDADEVKVGDALAFVTVYPVKYGEIVLIPDGTPVTGQVLERRNNFIFGMPGQLTVGKFHLRLTDEVLLPLHGQHTATGKSRYKCLVGLLWLVTAPLILVKGEDAKIAPGLDLMLTTVRDMPLPGNAVDT